MSLRVHFFKSDKPREWLLADAVLRGAKAHGCIVSSSSLGEPYTLGAYDVACFVGVKSRELYQEHHAHGTHTLIFDKGYSRHRGRGVVAGWEYWRVALDSHHPTARLAALSMPDDRFRRLGLEVQPWRIRGTHILIAGSSAKYHAFYGINNPTRYARELVREIRRNTVRTIWYRPKPSWREARPIAKARYSRPPETIADALTHCWTLVTHGSNACFEAMISGIPSVVLGDGVARVISSTDISEVESPRLASDKERIQLLSNLAYHQWNLSEFACGEAWDFIGGEIHAGE